MVYTAATSPEPNLHKKQPTFEARSVVPQDLSRGRRWHWRLGFMKQTDSIRVG